MNKKKICIGIVIILSVVIVIVLMKMFFYNRQAKIENENIFPKAIISDDDNSNKTIEQDNIPQNDIEENIDIPEDIVVGDNPVIEETTETTSTTKQEKTTTSSNSKPQTTSESNSKIMTKVTTKTENEVKPQIQENQETTSQVPIQEQQNEQTKENSKKDESTKVEEKQETVNVPTPTPVVEPIEETKDEEKYVRNDAMINKIKEVIQSNESEYMKNYGYEIVVDSSIKGQANPFTFTETRVKGYITYTFGTIKIYAEDYYKNGQLIMTDCYIY